MSFMLCQHLRPFSGLESGADLVIQSSPFVFSYIQQGGARALSLYKDGWPVSYRASHLYCVPFV